MKQKLCLNLEKPVVVFPQLVRLFGGINQAIFWQQIYYWSDKGKNSDGWVYKTKEELEEETTLSRYKQDRVRKKLEKEGYLESKLKKTNGTPVLHYRVNIGKVRNLLMEKRETNHSISKKLTNPLYTENTTDTTAKQGFAGKDINELIDLFKDINPSYKKFFSNKTQRLALERLVEQHGREKIEWAIKIIPQTNQMKYAPTITTLLQLEDKLASLIVFLKKSKRDNPVIL